MTHFARFITRHNILITIIFGVSVILSFFAMQFVSVNYNMADYLPDSAPSTQSIDTMQKEFNQDVPNARVMVPDITVPEALSIKEQLKEIDGVEAVQWLDDLTDIRVSLQSISSDLLNKWYKDGTALFSVTIKASKDASAIASIQNVIGKNGIVSGSLVDRAYAKDQSMKEVQRILYFVIPVVLLILLLTTQSYFEPVLFLITIGAAILLNRGTNLFFGQISFITEAAQSILQLAVSMDYAIILLHRFSEFRKSGLDVSEAMVQAVPKTFSTVLSSGLTTIVGFAALILMRFKIGPDMGLCMAKGILFSLISVLTLLPALTVTFYKLIDKTQHRAFLPSFEKFGKLVCKVGIPALMIFLVVAVPSYLAKQHDTFFYGASNIYSDQAKITKDKATIDNIFGKSTDLVLMVPKGNLGNEQALEKELHGVLNSTSVISYVGSVGAQIPYEFVPEQSLSQLESENYSLMMINIAGDPEGDDAFTAVEQVRNLAQKYYPNQYYLAGDSASTYDIRDTFETDQSRIDVIAILAIGLIILLTFRSLSIPVLLVTVIESSIWVNLAIPYFQGKSICFISYLIISSIQLGATVDYAILLTSRYFEKRREHMALPSAIGAVKDAALPILTSASILTICGMSLGMVSSNAIISELGYMIGRGTILSTLFVLFVLPTLLRLLDKVIVKTTWKLSGQVYKGESK